MKTLDLYKSDGFTILEIIIVCIIISITAAIAIPYHIKTVKRANLQKAEALLEMIYDAEQYYKLNHPSEGYVFGESKIKELESIHGNDIKILEDKGFETNFNQERMSLSYEGCTLSIDISSPEREVKKTKCTLE